MVIYCANAPGTMMESDNLIIIVMEFQLGGEALQSWDHGDYVLQITHHSYRRYSAATFLLM